jgi:hypothetical protein
MVLYLAVARSKVPFILWARLPGEDGRVNGWHRSRREAAERAIKAWNRATANQAAGTYDIDIRPNGLPEPEWPEYPFAEILASPFGVGLSSPEDHPVIRRLRGLNEGNQANWPWAFTRRGSELEVYRPRLAKRRSAPAGPGSSGCRAAARRRRGSHADRRPASHSSFALT